MWRLLVGEELENPVSLAGETEKLVFRSHPFSFRGEVSHPTVHWRLQLECLLRLPPHRQAGQHPGGRHSLGHPRPLYPGQFSPEGRHECRGIFCEILSLL